MKRYPKLFKTHSFEVKRYIGDAYDPNTGLSQKREFISFSEEGSIQPLTGTEKLQLPEGDRSRNIKKVFTEFQLLTDDVIIHKDQSFETISVECFDSTEKFPYYLAKVGLIDVKRN